MKTAKRFYKNVTITPIEDHFGVLLDGRTLKTPQKQTLKVHAEKIANLIAGEWDAQIETIKPETMPITRLVNVSIELTPSHRPKLIEEARRYAGTDLLCYRATIPVRLAEKQAELWDPVLAWAANEGIELAVTDAVLAIEQDKAALEKIAQYADTHDDLRLTLFVHLIAVFGSAILAKAVMKKRLTGQEAFALSRLDNIFQIDQWGEDEEAAEITANLETEILALCQILET